MKGIVDGRLNGSHGRAPMSQPSQMAPSQYGGGLPARLRRPPAARAPRRNLLLDIPIGWRLALGFLLAALIAASAAGFSGIQRAQSLNQESQFYQDLLASNTALNNDASFLQLMNVKAQGTLDDATQPNPSKETLAQDVSALQNLIKLYDGSLTSYTGTQLLEQHSDRVALLSSSGNGQLPAQQSLLAASATRTWRVYHDALTTLIDQINQGDTDAAAAGLRAQAEPTNADALSALRAVIQFDGRLAGYVHDAALAEQQTQTIWTLIAALVAFILVGIVGWVISGTVVRRLQLLRGVSEAVERGEMQARVEVIGRDEIGRVSASVNDMLDEIVGLLDVTRRQRDAMQNAAERLFADVRIAGTGDLRVNAPVSDDPIGMLANAFNFTVGRFRRFVLRTQTSLSQLDTIARQEYERAEAFLAAARPGRPSVPSSNSSNSPNSLPNAGSPLVNSINGMNGMNGVRASTQEARIQLARARELLMQIAREGANRHARAVLDLAEQAYLSAGRLSQMAATAYNSRGPGASESYTRAQMEELQTLGGLLVRLGKEAHSIQQNATAGMGELDATLNTLGGVLGSIDAAQSVPSAQSSPRGALPAGDLTPHAVQLAQEVAQMARQIVMIAQDLHAHVAPFRLEQVSMPPNEDGYPTLYTPGTGYAGPNPYGN